MIVILCFVVFHCFAEVNVEAYQKTFCYDEILRFTIKFPGDGQMNTLRLLMLVVITLAEIQNESIEYMCTVPLFSIGFIDFLSCPR